MSNSSSSNLPLNSRSSRKWLEELHSGTLAWSPREDREEILQAIQNLARNPDLKALLLWLEFQKQVASNPAGPLQDKWKEVALHNAGRISLIRDLAQLLTKHYD